MAKVTFKFNTKEFEKQLTKQVNEVVKNKQKELLIQSKMGSNSMNILGSNEETMLDVFIDKYNKINNYEIEGNYDEFPDYMRFCIKDTMQCLKYAGLISSFDNFFDGWHVILTPDAMKYYNKKGSRIELFNELAKSDKALLKQIIEEDEKDGNISELLREKIAKDPKNIVRGIIGNLKSNGLLSVSWADNTICNALLTQSGRTYFERENEYNIKNQKTVTPNIYNIENINAPNSNLVVGNVFDSTLVMNDTITKIESEIETKCDIEEEKILLRELLEETKEIIENYKESNHFDTRKGFFKKLTYHLSKHGWFYAEITNLIGQAVLMKIGGQN